MIVVGVDGSEGSLAALRFALEEAKLRGSEVRAVNVWHIPPAVYEANWAPATADLDEFEVHARAALEQSLAAVGAGSASVTVTPVLVEGQAADVLCAQAEGADLLVVGSRGRGGFAELLLG
jgi:nucleotide-binding universal stress UspA family protein